MTIHKQYGAAFCLYQKETMERIKGEFEKTRFVSDADVVFFARESPLSVAAWGNVKAVAVSHSHSEGLEKVPRHVAVCRPTDFKGVTSTVEHTWGLVHAVHRALPTANNAAFWDREPFLVEKQLSEMTMTVVGGYGRIGSRIVQAGRLFCKDVFITGEREGRAQLQNNLIGTDILVICASLTESSRDMIDEEAISLLRKGAFIINTARGEILSLPAVISALEGKHLSGVGLDVLPGEFAPPEGRDFTSFHYLKGMQRKGYNVVITPHIGGSCRSARLLTEMSMLDNVLVRMERENGIL